MKIAITGHQNIEGNRDKSWLERVVNEKLIDHEIELGYSCLAIGADQLFTEILVKLKIPFIGIIPCLNYESTFDDNTIDNYKNLLSKAFKVIQLEYKEPSEAAFFEASKLMVNYCDVLFAIWNDQPAKGLGGTADVVKFAKDSNKPIVQFNPSTKKVKIL
jgi:hypothetical protein